MKLRHGQAVWLMVVVTLLWSTAGVATRHLQQARSFEVTFWRAFAALLTLLLILGVSRGKALWHSLRGGDRALWISGICWSVMFTAYMLALTLTTVGNVLVTMALGPLCTALIARVWIGHRIARHTWAAIVMAGAGIAWIYGGQLAQGVSLLGTLVALCVPLAGATNWTVTQRAAAHGHAVDLVPAVVIGAFIASLVCLPLAWPFQANAHDLSILGLLGAVQLAIPCIVAVRCAQVLKAPEVSLLALLEVIFGILLAWAGAGEAPGSRVLVGGTMVIAALVANELVGWRRAAKPITATSTGKL